jgi:hypothetical protein
LPGDVEIIDLSPLPPLGTTSILTTVNQNNVVSTVRNVEVAADTTNLLALECAKQRQELLQKKETKTIPLNYARARYRLGQAFENKNFSACFNVLPYALQAGMKETISLKWHSSRTHSVLP